ncbi:response regulator [Kistimonas asteriae]|uniref:response regulator n=1 Tax=Kistimonas asteriae TaxID=517724 RepID=UPI001BA80A02|nr:response regulator [Kistimonas asteriae]
MTKAILVVDDVVELREELALCLEDEGFRVFQAENGVEALNVLKQQEDVSIVITDILMPKMDGMELCTEIRKSRPGMKIVAISGGGKVSEENHNLVGSYLRKAQREGADVILEKPFALDDLLNVL